MSQNNKVAVVSNVFWRLLERFGAQGVTFIVSIILARLLDPNVYGAVALVTVFISILQVFVDSGLGNALIQKKSADDIDFSTVFFFNVVFCLILYALIFFAAPWIASFYNQPELVPVVRALSLTIVISGVKNVQQAYVSKNMMFKRFFFATLGGTIGAAIIGIYMAYNGYGIWAIVFSNLFNIAVDTTILWLTVKWRPKLLFSFKRLKGLFSYGWKLLVSNLIDTVYEDLRTLVIGKMYSSDDLAFYNKGKQFPNLLVSNLNTSIDSVLFPAMSEAQDNPTYIKSMTRRAIKTTTYFIMPLMVGLAACSKPFISILLTDKWLDCVPYMQVLCFAIALHPILIANLNAIKAMGRSDIYLKLEIARKIVGFSTLFATMWISPYAIAWGVLANSLLNQIVNAWPNKSLLRYGYLEQVRDILPEILLSLFMGVLVYSVRLLGMSNWVTLIIQVPLGVVVYLGASILFRFESFLYMLPLVNGFLNKKVTKYI